MAGQHGWGAPLDMIRDTIRVHAIHVIGPSCAGKSHLIRAAGLPSWDVLEFYASCGAWRRGEPFSTRLMHSKPALWRRKTEALERELEAFLRGGGVRAVESSGINERIDSVVRRARKVTRILLTAPPEDELRRRAKRRGLSLSNVVGFSHRFGESLHGAVPVTYDQALRTIREAIGSSEGGSSHA